MTVFYDFWVPLIMIDWGSQLDEKKYGNMAETIGIAYITAPIIKLIAQQKHTNAICCQSKYYDRGHPRAQRHQSKHKSNRITDALCCSEAASFPVFLPLDYCDKNNPLKTILLMKI